MRRIAAAQRQAGRSFGLAAVGVAEPDDLRKGQRIVAGGDVTKHSAGRHRGQLVVIADESHARPTGKRVTDHRVEFGGRGLTRFVDDDESGGVDAVEPTARRVVDDTSRPSRTSR